MRVLITGAAGFLGYHVVKEFFSAGWHVRATDVPNADFTDISQITHEIAPCDLIEDDLSDLVKGVDVIAHVAGLFDLMAPYEDHFNTNVKATGRLCAASVGRVSKFIHVSTAGVYGVPKVIPCKEDTPKRPRNAYEKTKYEGERIVSDFLRCWRLPVVIARPTLIYGPRSKYGHAMIIGLMALSKARGTEKMPGVRKGLFTHSVHVEDVASAIFFLANKDGVVGEVFNIADETPIRLEAFIKAMMDPIGIKLIPIIPQIVARPLTYLFSKLGSPYDRLKQIVLERWDEEMEKRGLKSPLRPRLDQPWRDYFSGNFMYDISKLKSLGFKFKYPDFAIGMAQTVKWYRENGWIP